MTIENLQTFFSVEFLFRAFLILFLGFYFFFSILLIRQVQTMTQSLSTKLNRVLKLLTYLNLIIASLFLVLAIIV